MLVGSGGDQVLTFALPRMINGIAVAIASPFSPRMLATQRFIHPSGAPLGRALPFSTQSCASKCERPW